MTLKPLLTPSEQRAHNFHKQLASLYVRSLISDKEFNEAVRLFKLVTLPVKPHS